MRSALSTLTANAHASNDCQIEWVADVIANYCIANKLKTSFGKAQETLGAFERTMRHLATNFEKQISSEDQKFEKIQQARNFLVVFDSLEKAMIQAWDGTNLSAFFVANRKTCLDWLARMRYEKFIDYYFRLIGRFLDRSILFIMKVYLFDVKMILFGTNF